METIKEAKIYLRSNLEKGSDCPCCNQKVKSYRRNLNYAMSLCLIKLSGMDQKFHHVSKIVEGISNTGTADFSKLKYWGLIQEKENLDTSKKNSGFWKITESGINFAQNKTNLPKYVTIYNKINLGFSSEEINIIEALGYKFNYYDLINNL